MRDRVRPPRDLEFVLDRLKDEGVFETKQKGLIFAAAVGFALRREEIAGVDIEHFGEGIRLEYFRTPQDEGYIDLLAVTNMNDLGVLDSDRHEERISLFEKYAFLGLQEMKRCCLDDRPEDSLLGLLSLLDSMEHASEEDLPGLDSTVKQLEKFV